LTCDRNGAFLLARFMSKCSYCQAGVTSALPIEGSVEETAAASAWVMSKARSISPFLKAAIMPFLSVKYWNLSPARYGACGPPTPPAQYGFGL
jgi:hypothetical protein